MADRPRRRRIDPRLLIGVVLVIGSLLGVWAIVRQADTTEPAYVAARALAVGDTIDPHALETEPVHLGPASSRYLTPGRHHGALIVTRPIGAGELVPLDALGDADDVTGTRVVVEVGGALPQTVRPGAEVALWAARRDDGRSGDDHAPRVLVDTARVVRLIDGHGVVGGTQTVSVELHVPAEAIAGVLQARADDDVLSIVPHGTDGTGRG